MDYVLLQLTHIGQLGYTSDTDGKGFYSVNAVGTTDTVYSVKGERKAVIGSFGLSLKCPELPGGFVRQHAWCATPEAIEKPDDGYRVRHDARLQVAIGEHFLRLLIQGGFKGVPMLGVSIKGVDMGTELTDHKPAWDTAETSASEIISVSAYFDTSAVMQEDIEQARIDPMPELMAATTKKIEELYKMVGWLLAIAGVIAVGVWIR